jgi:hypothetical protein
LEYETPGWCNHFKTRFAAMNYHNVTHGKTLCQMKKTVRISQYDRKKVVIHELQDDYLKTKKTKMRIEYLSNEPKKTIRKEIKFRNEPWNWIVRKATVIISKVTSWLKSFLMWKKIRGSKERMKIFETSPPISFFKPFNTGILALQEEFSIAKEDPMKYLLDEDIKQMTR